MQFCQSSLDDIPSIIDDEAVSFSSEDFCTSSEESTSEMTTLSEESSQTQIWIINKIPKIVPVFIGVKDSWPEACLYDSNLENGAIFNENNNVNRHNTSHGSRLSSL